MAADQGDAALFACHGCVADFCLVKSSVGWRIEERRKRENKQEVRENKLFKNLHTYFSDPPIEIPMESLLIQVTVSILYSLSND